MIVSMESIVVVYIVLILQYFLCTFLRLFYVLCLGLDFIRLHRFYLFFQLPLFTLLLLFLLVLLFFLLWFSLLPLLFIFFPSFGGCVIKCHFPTLSLFEFTKHGYNMIKVQTRPSFHILSNRKFPRLNAKLLGSLKTRIFNYSPIDQSS